MEHVEKYTSISQRAAASYLRQLAGCEESTPEQRDLGGFFQAFYTALYEQPEQFGLPLVEDDSFVEGEPGGTGHKTELNKKLKKPRDLITAALDFLMFCGCAGRLDGQALVVNEEAAARLKKTRGLRTFFQGLNAAGLVMSEAGGALALSNPRFPAMLPALIELAQACAANPDANLSKFNFTRCDFRALRPGYSPDPLDLYSAFPPADYEKAAALHEFFCSRGYQAVVSIHDVTAWLVQYQGSRKVKATPLFQVEYQERYRLPMTMYIKPASTSRIAPLIPQQSQALQDDFFRRANYCRGKECDWCKTRPHLGPTPMKRGGQPVVVCWYTNPNIVPDEHTVGLIEEYAVMHENLLNPSISR